VLCILEGEGQAYPRCFNPLLIRVSGTAAEDIFARSGHAARIANLQTIFNMPDRYGKGLDWTGYTIHDAAGILLRYLKSLPEPVVPYHCYDSFTRPLLAWSASGHDEPVELMEPEWHSEAVRAYQGCIADLPPLNRHLLLYLLDVLAVFASKFDLNRMTANRLACTFNPALVSRKPAEMDETEHRLAQNVIVFLIDNQDHFLLGMT